MAIKKNNKGYYVTVDKFVDGIKVRFKKEGFEKLLDAEIYEMEETQNRVLKAKKQEILDNQKKELDALKAVSEAYDRTLEDAVNSYMLTIDHLEETTRDQYNDRINKYIYGSSLNMIEVTNKRILVDFFNPLRKNTKIKNISTELLQKWKNEVNRIDGSFVGSQTKQRIIRIILEVLTNEEHDHKNVVANLNPKNFRAPRKEVREMNNKSRLVISEKDFDLMLSKVDEMTVEGLFDKLLLEVYWLTSGRRNEVIGLKVSDVGDGVISFTSAVRNSRKKGTMVSSRMKTDSSYRTVDVPTRLTDNLIYFINLKYGKIDNEIRNKYVFSLSDGTRPVSPNSVSRRVAKYARLAKEINPLIEIPTIKDLRSSSINSYFQTIFKKSEGSFQDYDNVIALAAKRMGHSNSDTTKIYYLEALSIFEEERNLRKRGEIVDEIDSNFNNRSKLQAMMLTTSIPQ